MQQVALLATVVITGIVQVWHVIFLSAGLGIINAFDIPIRQSFVVQMVDRRHVFHELREGTAYCFGFAPIRKILLLVALVALAGMSYAVLMPVFARHLPSIRSHVRPIYVRLGIIKEDVNSPIETVIQELG